MKKYTDTPKIIKLVSLIQKENLHEKVYSDIIDENGNQYVDLVQEGGGVLGIALVGYTYILEKCGIRFFSLAGTSAGAINTMMIAGMAEIGKPSSEKILEILSKKDLFDFADGDKAVKRLFQQYIEERSFIRLKAFFRSLRILKILNNNMGLNPGNEFRSWIESNLKDSGIKTLSQLNAFRTKTPKLIDRIEQKEILRTAELKIIASDITSKSKVVFPEMAELYWSNPNTVKPSEFVRASMSIPLFFEPYIVSNIPGGGTNPSATNSISTKWEKHVGYRGKIPQRVHFVDGGMLSNFPINTFHIKSGNPKKPTFGVRLSTWRDEYNDVDSLITFCGNMISTMRQLHDYDFLVKNSDYNKLICYIDADSRKNDKDKPYFNWLDFNMPEAKKIELFTLGAEKALNFLRNFNWARYKEIRENKKH